MNTTAAMETETETEYSRARTSVWWDTENCEVPKALDPHLIARNITSSLAKMNLRGPLSIFAYGDTNRIPSSVQQALSSTGIALYHVPSGGRKDASDMKILVDMMLWALDNPAPANLMLISSDDDFSNALHQLRMRGYNILLAQPRKAASAALLAAAKSVWLWTSLAAGGRALAPHESSLLVPNAHPSDPGISNHAVAEPVPSSGRLDLNSDSGRIVVGENNGDHILKTSNQPVKLETHRGKLPIEGATSDSVSPTCHHAFNDLGTSNTHLSGKRQAAQPAIVLSGGGGSGPCIALTGSQVNVSTRPSKKRKLEQPLWCCVCQISCNNEVDYENHKSGQSHQKKLKSKGKNTCMGPGERPEDDGLEKKKKRMIEYGAKASALKVCSLCDVVCNSQTVFESHLRGLRHAEMVKNQAGSS